MTLHINRQDFLTTVMRMRDVYRLFASILLVLLVSMQVPAAVLVEGAPVNAEVHPTEILVKYGPIFDALKIMHSYNAETRTIKVRRPYDNAVLELVVPEGQVRANARLIGTIPNADREKPADGWLSPNAISILSGTIARNTADGWAFDLDERLRPDANLQLWINGKPVTPPVPPRSAGALLLVPLRPVAEALGSKITVDGTQVSVVRLQDGVVVSWNSASGLIVANKRPMGVVATSALVDLPALLLPRDAVAALTGTNIQLVPGTNRVEANLDDRLAEFTTPTGQALDRARRTPAEIERVNFQLGTAGTNLLSVRGHSGLYSANLRLEAPATGAWLGRYNNNVNQVENPFRPNWASLEWQSLLGLSGIVGDGVASRRELDGVSVTRWRGAALQVPIDAGAGGSLRFVAGEMLANAPTTTDGSFYPTFGGSVFGTRWYAADGNSEVGLNFKRDAIRDEGNLGVLSWTHQERWQAASLDGVTTSLYADVSAGHLDRVLGGWGGRSTVSLNSTFANTWNASSSANYTSGVFNGTLIRDINGHVRRPADTGGLDMSVGGPIDLDASLSGRVFGWRTGIEDPLESRSHGWGINFSRQWPLLNATASLDYSTAVGDGALNETPVHTDVDRISLTLDKRFDEAIWTARLEDTRSRGAIAQHLRSATMTYTVSPWLWVGAQNQSLSFSPLISASWSRAETAGSSSSSFSQNVAANMAFQSGTLLGEVWRVSLNAGWSGFRNSARDERTNTLLTDLLTGNVVTVRSEQKATSSGWYFNMRSQHRLSRFLSLEWGANKTQGGDPYAYLQLNGAFDFAPALVKALPKAGRGVIEGLLYFDENGNGKQDPGERGIPWADVRLSNTPYALRTSGTGNFTINNLPQGPYTVSVDLGSLPLGFRVGNRDQLRVSVLDQQVTEIKIPIIEVGQIRGRVFIDRNANGIADEGEADAIGRRVLLFGEGVTLETQTAVFGQFVFDLVPLGSYTLKVGDRESRIDITQGQKFAVRNIGLNE